MTTRDELRECAVYLHHSTEPQPNAPWTRAWFHGFFTVGHGLIMAVVELDDGSVVEVHPQKIRFGM